MFVLLCPVPLVSTVKALVLAATYLATYYFAFVALLALNLSLLPDVPWAVLAQMLGTVMVTALLSPRLTSYGLCTLPRPSGPVATYVLLSTALTTVVLVLGSSIAGVTGLTVSAPESASATLAAAIALGVPISTAFAEEFAFRGILLSRISQLVSRRAAIGFTTALFCAIHITGPAFLALLPGYLVLAIVTGAVATHTKSVLPAFCIHIAVNLCLTIMTVVFGSIDYEQIPWELQFLMLVLCCVACPLIWMSLRRVQVASEGPMHSMKLRQ